MVHVKFLFDRVSARRSVYLYKAEHANPLCVVWVKSAGISLLATPLPIKAGQNGSHGNLKQLVTGY